MVGFAIAIVINLITAEFSAVLCGILAALVVIAVYLTLFSAGDEKRSPADDRNREGPSSIQRTGVLEQSLKKVEAMLDGSIRPVLPLDLAIETRPDLSGSGQPGGGDGALRSRFPARLISEEFENNIRRLIILGAAGSGKTTLLFELARNLILSAQRGASPRIPVALNLASWSARDEDLAAWLHRKVCTENNFEVNDSNYWHWLEGDEFVFLLDGIDEIEDEDQRTRCCREIAKFRNTYKQTYFAVCCRTTDFAGLGDLLNISDVVELQPPSREEVDSFLSAVETRGTGITAIRIESENDEDFASFLCSPLVLQLVVSIYASEPAASTARLCKPGTPEQRLARLWDEYIDKMFTQRPLRHQEYTEGQAKVWLAWLARAMVTWKTDAFQLDRLTFAFGKGKNLQPKKYLTLYHDSRDRCYRPPPWLFLLILLEGFIETPPSVLAILTIPLGGPARPGVLLGIAYLAVGGHIGIWRSALVALLGATAFSVLFVRQHVGSRIGQGWPPVERIHWSRSHFFQRIRWSVAYGLSNGLAGGLIASIRVGILNGLRIGLVLGAAASVGICAINGLEIGSDKTLAQKTAPDAGFRRSLRYALQFTIAGGLLGFAIGGLIGFAAGGREGGVALGIGSAWGMGLFAGRAFGGGAYISYCNELAFLTQAHAGPWRYGAFLQSMTLRTILRREERAFYFVHRKLHDYLAGRDDLAEETYIGYPEVVAGNNEGWSARIMESMRPRVRTDVGGRFRKDARDLIERAQEAARQRQHGNVTPQHILLALIDEPDNSAVKTMLTPAQVDQIRSRLRASMRQGSENFSGDIPLTRQARAVFQLAQREASRLEYHAIGSEHILLGFIRAPGEEAANVLSGLGIYLEEIRRQLAPDTVRTARTLTHAGGMSACSSVAFSPDGRLLASCGDDSKVRLWDPASGEQLRVLAGHTGRVGGVAFSPDGRLLASCGDDSKVRLWDPASREQPRVLAGHTGRVGGVAFSPDGRLLASCGDDSKVRLWDPASGLHRRTLTHAGVLSAYTSVAFSPDGQLLASCGKDKIVRLWDPVSGLHRRTLTHAGMWSAYTSVAFSPDGQLLASCGNDSKVRLWDLT